MIEITGDYWQIAKDFSNNRQFIACVCTTNKIVKSNGELVMGAGIAKQFKEKFPELPKIWGDKISKDLDINVMVETDFDDLYHDLVAFPTKNDWRDDSCMNLIEKSARELSIVAKALSWDKVIITRPGCGNGNLRWQYVKSCLGKILNTERFVVVNNV